MAFSMFSTIPMPHIEWNEKSMRYALAAFPLVGALIAVLLGIWMWICSALGLDRLIMGLGVMLIPLAVTGGIHIDGFSDTVDALASHAEPEKKRQILKDSHIGAFAGIGIGAYLISYFAIACQLYYGPLSLQFTICCLCLAPILSRTMSGIVSISFPGSGHKGLLQTFRDSTSKRGALIFLFILLAACLVFAFACISWMVGLGLVIVIVLVTTYLYFMSRHQFGGMSGDLSGFYLQVLEILFLVVFAIVEGLVFV
jgi:adenosylcobinamide-GDP ribazoletransferase